jgi:hypothetical protein
MNSYLPIPDRIPGVPGEDRKKKEKDPIEKIEEKNEVISFFAIIIILTSIPAGIHTLEIWHSPSPATDFDVFLFFYAIIGFPIGLVMQSYANYMNNPHVHDIPWWW